MRIGIKKTAKRILKILLAILVFLIALLPARYINTIYGYLPALFLAILMIASFVCLTLVWRKLNVESDFMDVQCERGNSVGIGLKIRNNSRISCPQIMARIFISDLFGAVDSLTRTYFTMPGKENTEFSFDMDMAHIGVYHVGIKDMEISDFFGFFKKKVPVSGDFEVYVKPRLRSLEEIHVNEEVMAESDQDTRMTVVNGTDYIGVREYEMGDSMKQIHWKLSAHSSDYMTKMYVSSRQMDFAVLLDFAADANDDSEALMDINDCLIETALSVIEDISHRHTSHSLIYCNKDKNVERTTVKGRENDLELIKDFSVITPEPGPNFPDALQILQDEGRMINRSTNVIICTSRLTDELIAEIQSVKRQRRNPELYYIVPARWSSRDIETKKAKLRQLEEQGIRYSFVSTAENLSAKGQEA